MVAMSPYNVRSMVSLTNCTLTVSHHEMGSAWMTAAEKQVV